MILHTVNKSPLTDRTLGSCLQFMGAEDSLVLLEDGVYAALQRVDCGLERIEGRVYAIGADVDARGLRDRLGEGIAVIDYGAFVDLCASSDVVKNW